MSEERKHTPGPWVVWDQDGSIGTVETNDGIAIAQAQIIGPIRSQNKDTVAERKANALLIAASPSLLDALEAIINNAEKLDWDCYQIQGHEECEAIQKARSAIAAAKGRNSASPSTTEHHQSNE